MSDGNHALVLFAHGSRDPQWAEPFQAIRRKVARARPELTVELAFLEMIEPALPKAVEHLAASGHARVTIAPLFMARGAHVKRDLSALLDEMRKRHPGLEVVVLPATGEVDELIDAIGAWLANHA